MANEQLFEYVFHKGWMGASYKKITKEQAYEIIKDGRRVYKQSKRHPMDYDEVLATDVLTPEQITELRNSEK